MRDWTAEGFSEAEEDADVARTSGAVAKETRDLTADVSAGGGAAPIIKAEGDDPTGAADTGSGAAANEAVDDVAPDTPAVFDGNLRPARDDAEERLRDEDREAVLLERAERYAARAVLSEARATAALMGVPENRLDDIAKLCELSGIDPEEAGTRARIVEMVRDALNRVPGLRCGSGTGSTVSPRKPRRDAFERGFLGA